MEPPPPTQDALVDDLIDRLMHQRHTLAGYRRALFALPDREQDAVKLAQAERRLQEAVEQLADWRNRQPTSCRNTTALT